jgi:hypothetical protein
MLSNPHFYNRTIRKVVVAFGTIFNDIEVIRFQKDGTLQHKMTVPLSYGAKEKYITRITSNPNLTKSVNTVVPRMSFNLDGLTYDISRKKQTTLQNFSYTQAAGVTSQYMPVPYNFDFSMSIYVRHTEDGTQILEQILPFFTPDFTVTVNFIDSMCQKYDMPIILNSVTNNTDYEGDMLTTRLITWDLQFTAKGYIWPPAKGGRGLIGQYSDVGGDDNDGGYGGAIVNVYNMDSDVEIATVKTQVDPLDATPDDEYGFSETIIEYNTGYQESQLKYLVYTSDSTLIFTNSSVITIDTLLPLINTADSGIISTDLTIIGTDDQ